MNLIGEALPPESQAIPPSFVSNHYQPDRPPPNAGGHQLPVHCPELVPCRLHQAVAGCLAGTGSQTVCFLATTCSTAQDTAELGTEATARHAGLSAAAYCRLQTCSSGPCHSDGRPVAVISCCLLR